MVLTRMIKSRDDMDEQTEDFDDVYFARAWQRRGMESIASPKTVNQLPNPQIVDSPIPFCKHITVNNQTDLEKHK